MKKIIALLLSICILCLAVTSCSKMASPLTVKAGEEIVPNGKNVDEAFKESVYNFAFDLTNKLAKENENLFFSPFSVYSALALVANGADGNTKEQFCDMFGLSIEDLNSYLYTFYSSLQDTKDGKLLIANSVWTDEKRLDVNEEYLKQVIAYHNADIYREDFSSKDIVDKINGWCAKKTNNMIKEIVDEIPSNYVMCLLNAMYFDMKWAEKFNTVLKDDFTNYDGTVSNIDFMKSQEDIGYIGEDYVGFKKQYKGNCSFIAVLPDEKIDIYDFVSTLDYKKYSEILSSATQCKVNTLVPKMDIDYSANLVKALSEMGIEDAFNEVYADFSKLGNATNKGNMYIDTVLHKAKLSLDEEGTKAAAVTFIGVGTKSAMPMTEIIDVYLNRPFVMMIVDNATNTPLFVGVVSNM